MGTPWARWALAGALVLVSLALSQGLAQDGEGPSARILLEDQATAGQVVLVDQAHLPEGGFVVIYDARFLGETPSEGILGASGAIGAGLQQGLPVTLEGNVSDGQAVWAVAHRDTNANNVFEHQRDQALDPWYENATGDPVFDRANLTLLGEEQGPMGLSIWATLSAGLAGALVAAGLLVVRGLRG